jgi:hypothetical protein
VGQAGNLLNKRASASKEARPTRLATSWSDHPGPARASDVTVRPSALLEEYTSQGHRGLGMESRSFGDGERAPGSGSRLQQTPRSRLASGFPTDGASRARTGDLLGAIQEGTIGKPALGADSWSFPSAKSSPIPRACPGILGMGCLSSPKRPALCPPVATARPGASAPWGGHTSRPDCEWLSLRARDQERADVVRTDVAEWLNHKRRTKEDEGPGGGRALRRS